MVDDEKPAFDWEAIERDYRAGVLSIREIGRGYSVSDTAIRKRAKAEEWTRPLADKVRKAVREKLVRNDGSQGGSHPSRTSDADIVDNASTLLAGVVVTHRKDLLQLHELKRTLADRLSRVLSGNDPEGVCLGKNESAGDLLEKLSRITSRLIPLERQAHHLDEQQPVLPGAIRIERVIIDPANTDT